MTEKMNFSKKLIGHIFDKPKVVDREHANSLLNES